MQSASNPEEILNALKEKILSLEEMAQNAAAHKKKFLLAISQLLKFSNSISLKDPDFSTASRLDEAHHEIEEVLNGMQSLLLDYQRDNWIHKTLQTPVSEVMSMLCASLNTLGRIARSIDEEISLCFSDTTPEWIQSHKLDLIAIEASFTQYKQNCDENDSALELVNQCLKSINEFMEDRYDPDTDFYPINIHNQAWKLIDSDFERIKKIGGGVFTDVYYGVDKRTGTEVAIKEMRYIDITGEKLKQFKREVCALATAAHPTLLGFIGATDTHPFCILTEWVPKGTLFDYLRSGHEITPTQKTIIAFDIARGMAYLHSKNVIHRNLHLGNIFLDKHLGAKISGHELSRFIEEASSLATITEKPHWMAPERIRGDKECTAKADVYSYGIMLYELAAEETHFQDLDPCSFLVQVVVQHKQPIIPSNVPEVMRHLIVQCWDDDPANRPSFEEVIRVFLEEGACFADANKEAVCNHFTRSLIEDGKADLATKTNLDDIFEQYIPNDLVERYWNVLTKHRALSGKMNGQAAMKFLNRKDNRAIASFVASLAPYSVDFADLKPLVELLPSGDSELDTDLLVCACKNGAAEYAAINASKPAHLRVALEIIAQCGLDSSLKAAVTDRCVRCLKSTDPGLVCAALRCLVRIDQVQRIGLQALCAHISSSDLNVIRCVLAVSTAIANKGIQIPTDIIEYALAHIEMEQSQALVYAACGVAETAVIIANRIIYENNVSRETALKILMIVARHADLRPIVALALQIVDFSCNEPETKEALDLLQTILA